MAEQNLLLPLSLLCSSELINITSSSRQILQPPSCQSQSWGLLGVHSSHLQTTLSSLAIPLSRLFLALPRFLGARLEFSSPFDLGNSSDRSVREKGSPCWPLYLVLTAFPFKSTSVFLRFSFSVPKAAVTEVTSHWGCSLVLLSLLNRQQLSSSRPWEPRMLWLLVHLSEWLLHIH
jgi:hypothetical protein